MLLDTNVLVSAILFGGLPRRLLDLGLRGYRQLVTSVALLDELEDVLCARFAFDRAAARLTRAELETIADLVDPGPIPAVARDPDDDAVLAAAVAGTVAVIVTGDRDLVVLETHVGIAIATPRQFADQQLPGVAWQ